MAIAFDVGETLQNIPAATQLAPERQLSRNPMLPQHPLGAYTDAQYEAQIAMLRADVAKAYNDVLRQLGYTDEQGNFIMGDVETQAARARGEHERGARLGREQVTQQAQRDQTLFSGRRATETARAEHPFIQAIANMDVDVPRRLHDLYGEATGLIDEYTRNQNLMLAEAAQRAALRTTQDPGVMSLGGVQPAPELGGQPLAPTGGDDGLIRPTDTGTGLIGPNTIPIMPGIGPVPYASPGPGAISNRYGGPLASRKLVASW